MERSTCIRRNHWTPLVSISIRPEPYRGRRNDNTMLIIGAVIAVIIVAAIAVFLMKRNA